MTPAEFIEALAALLQLQGRHVNIRAEKGLSPKDGPSVYVNFVNLPVEVVKAREGGGAESENNRVLFCVSRFEHTDGRLKVEMLVSALPREYKLRAKTAEPTKIAVYLAAFLNHVVANVPPNFTHTKV